MIRLTWMSLALLAVLVIAAGPADANSVASSTMYFSGSLTDVGGGVYTGTIDATAGTYYIPGGPGTSWDPVDVRWENPDGTAAVGGWDAFALEGGTAYYDDAVQGTIGSDHDAYSNAGGWGAFWDPDVPDWNHYQMTLTATHWYLEYKGAALGTPMSGAMDWAGMFASEDDVGSYRGTVPSDPDANDGDAALNGGGRQAWDMDWTWGSEVIPLQMRGFRVNITAIPGTDMYEVSLTPSPEPGSLVLIGLGAFGLGLVARRRRRA